MLPILSGEAMQALIIKAQSGECGGQARIDFRQSCVLV
jgi:hypothetical protein